MRLYFELKLKESHLLRHWSIAAAIVEGIADCQCDRVARVLDEIDDVLVAGVCDVDVIDGQYVIADVQPAATFGRRALDYAADRRAGLVHRRDYHEAEALVLHSRHRHLLFLSSN